MDTLYTSDRHVLAPAQERNLLTVFSALFPVCTYTDGSKDFERQTTEAAFSILGRITYIKLSGSLFTGDAGSTLGSALEGGDSPGNASICSDSVSVLKS